LSIDQIISGFFYLLSGLIFEFLVGNSDVDVDKP